MKAAHLFIISIALAILSACGSSPAGNDENSTYNPSIHTLEIIEGLDATQTLVLASSDSQASTSRALRNNGVSGRCDELGEVDAGTYRRIPTHGNLNPCFKGIRRWKGNIIYGQYRPDDSSLDVWFITDSSGNVRHLPRAPRKGAGFKNGHIIKEFQGKPAYLDYLSRLVVLDMESGFEETVINDAVGHFVVLTRTDGDHVFYTDLSGGQRKKPDLNVERLTELDAKKFFFEDESGDLAYLENSNYFRRMLVDSGGLITDKVASAVPAAYQDFLDNGQPGDVPPNGPLFNGSLEGCSKEGGLMICGTKGFRVDSSGDLGEINWNTFQIFGTNPMTCLSRDYIYFSAGDKLTQINSNLLAFEHVITDETIEQLACLESGDLLIKTGSQAYQFDPVNKIKTILPSTVSEFIQ